jgi:hypothetical protein
MQTSKNIFATSSKQQIDLLQIEEQIQVRCPDLSKPSKIQVKVKDKEEVEEVRARAAANTTAVTGATALLLVVVNESVGSDLKAEPPAERSD